MEHYANPHVRMQVGRNAITYYEAIIGKTATFEAKTDILLKQKIVVYYVGRNADFPPAADEVIRHENDDVQYYDAEQLAAFNKAIASQFYDDSIAAVHEAGYGKPDFGRSI